MEHLRNFSILYFQKLKIKSFNKLDRGGVNKDAFYTLCAYSKCDNLIVAQYTKINIKEYIMANTYFDPDLGAGKLQFKCTSVKVIDPAVSPSGFTNESNHVIDPNEPFKLEVNWEGEGYLLPIWMSAMSNSWSLRAYAESVGPGADVVLATGSELKSSAIVSGAGPTTKFKWTHTINVPAGKLTEDTLSNSGIYQLTVTMFANSAIPGDYDVSGFTQQPITIRVEDPA